MNSLAFSFTAEIIKVQTMVDNALRVTLDLTETEILAAAKLMEYKREGVTVKVSVEPE